MVVKVLVLNGLLIIGFVVGSACVYMWMLKEVSDKLKGLFL